MTMFVTLEPDALTNVLQRISDRVHIDKLYFGAYDEKMEVLKNINFALEKKHIFKTEIYGGIMENKCKNLLKKFF